MHIVPPFHFMCYHSCVMGEKPRSISSSLLGSTRVLNGEVEGKQTLVFQANRNKPVVVDLVFLGSLEAFDEIKDNNGNREVSITLN